MSSYFAFTPEAQSDALSIWEYIADTDSPRTADRVVAHIYDECEKLGNSPGIGHYRLELLNDHYRFWSAWSYLIAYRWEQTPIEVVGVVHGARNLSAFFSVRRP